MECYVILATLISVLYMNSAVPLAGESRSGANLATGDSRSGANLETGEYGNVFEGDMLLTAAQRAAIDKAANFPTNDNDVESRNGLVDFRSRWPDRTVVFDIKENDFDENQIKMILSAINDIAYQTCVKFRKRESENEHAVIIQGEQGLGCASEIGFNFYQLHQMLNLAENCFRHGSIVHEILHTLGFVHMQSTYDRDQFVTIYWQNIQDGRAHNFLKYTMDTVTDFGVPYDYGSVMHYHRTAFSKNGWDTIVPKQQYVKIGQRIGLSRSDVLKVNKMYECP